MGKLTRTLAILTLLSTCSARVISQNAVASALQDIMSPANTDMAMQMINMATRANNNVAMPNRNCMACNDRGRIVMARNEMPGRMPSNEIGIPRIAIANDGLPRLIEPAYPQQNVARQIVREPVPNIITQQSPYLPSAFPPIPFLPAPPVTNSYLPAPAAPISYLPAPTAPNSYSPVPTAPNPYLQLGPANPFLPAASPVSAMMMSSLQPPPTQSKGQFLRKIPISPPTI